MSILKGSIERLKDYIIQVALGGSREQEDQRIHFIYRVASAVNYGLDHYYFDEDDIDLIMMELCDAGYKGEKATQNQFRVSGW
ncbi:hypothetical protein [Carnobacterium divergens]|uniref:hypothetical protein n=1 Tax=Carnobacterium divergens TaxID=2748 RepID=UPI00288C6B0A|nr:hypothetical protein [Carnobacterium divergens]MDT2011159.1 hypothetical protein [Carnobacterium divergens]